MHTATATAAIAPSARVLNDLQTLQDLPEIVICARRSPAPYPDVDLTELLESAAERADRRRFTGAPLTGFGALA